MSDYLPEALVLEILHHLPPKTLVRCTSVCKAWNTIIKSHAFISSHLQHSLSNPTLSILILRHDPKHNSREICSLCSHTTKGPEPFAELHYSFPVSYELKKLLRVHFLNTINCVICLSHDRLGYTDLVILWNPFVQRTIHLPTPFFTLQTLQLRHNQCLFFVGFGYDSKTNDYKVVRICYRKVCIIPPLVEVYSLNEGAWRIIDASSIDVRIVDRARIDSKALPTFTPLLDRVSAQCFLHGKVHWLALEGNCAPFQYCVLMFDVEDETFKKIRLPQELNALNSYDLTICMIDGCISVIDYVNEGTEVCNIWMKREPESWNKVCYSNYLQTHFQRVFALMTSDEFFVEPLRGQYGPLHLFKSERKRMNKLGIQGEEKLFSFSEYTPSLVLFDRENVTIQCPMIKRCAEMGPVDEELEELDLNENLLRVEFISKHR